MSVIGEYFREEKLDFLNSIELDSAKYFKDTGRLELFCTVSAPLTTEKELTLKKLFAKKVGVAADSVKLILKNKNPARFNPSEMPLYIKQLKAQWREKGLKTCELALHNISFAEPNILFAEALSPIDLQLMARHNVETLIKEWFSENFDRDFRVELKMNDRTLAEVISEHRQQRDKEIEKAISQRTNSAQKKEVVQGDKKVLSLDEPVYGKAFTGNAITMDSIEEGPDFVIVEGEVFSVDFRLTKTGKTIVTFEFTDKTNSIKGKLFADEKTLEPVKEAVKEGKRVRARGEYVFDSYAKEPVFNVKALYMAESKKRVDTAPEKRVELHAHTVMSAYDGMIEPAALVERAMSWGHKAIAITDHGVLQANPDAFSKAAKNDNFTVIFGCEGYLIDDVTGLIQGKEGNIDDAEFVAFDIETTGLDKKNDAIIEIGAVKFKNGEILDKFDTFVDPERFISYDITQLTGITNEMVAGQPSIDTALMQFKEFIGDAVLVAHNASFDMSFIRNNAARLGIKIHNRSIDTLMLSKAMLPDIKKHSLDYVAQYLKINQIAHHRADDDARVCGRIFEHLLGIMKKDGVVTFDDLNRYFAKNYENRLPNYHIVILAKNKSGMFNLNKIVSEAHLNHYFKRPRIPRTLLDENRDNLVIGSACDAGELYELILHNADEELIRKTASYYDYLEIQPIGNCMHLVEDGSVRDEEDLRNINRRIVSLAKELGKPFAATGDVHFMEPEDDVFRGIIMSAKGFEDADNQAPLYFKTTDEMLDEFSYLGQEDCYKAVIEYPNMIASLAEKYKLMPDSLVAPDLPGAKEEIINSTWDKAHEIYGEHIPERIEKRINRELNSIISNGYQVLYLTAKKLVAKSNEDGYTVGSRGSVGASYVAYLTGITEVNALEAHYLCDKCKHVDFDVPLHACAFDLEDRMCPNCGIPMSKHGLDMPFEVFLGFKGDKVPDIDLNFSGDYQNRIHRYTETLFGKENVFKAGTISMIQDKTAYGIVKKYLEEHNKTVTSAEMNRLVKGCTGVKRTTGQHPAGMVVVPKDRSIYEFTALQHPADNDESVVTTTHYDFNFIHDTLVKLDLLGHDGPTLLKMLCDLSGITIADIPSSDKETMSLFSSAKALNIKRGELFMDIGTLGIPEYNTPFLRGILMKIKPTKFSELISINGLSHGEGIWIGNGLDLVESGTVEFDDVIATREQIMFKLINWGLDPKMSFDVMESVRKGRGMKPEWVEAMNEKNVPQWFIDSCRKIGYLFPKPHAAAYAQMSYRIAYFKVHYPLAFYATYFTIKAPDFDGTLAMQGGEAIKKRFLEVKELGKDAAPKDQNMQAHLETAYEMYCRGYTFYPVDLKKSSGTHYTVEDGGLRIPLSGLPGLPASAAETIYAARQEAEFSSVDDLKKRGGATKSVIEVLRNNGVLVGLPESAQIEFF